MVDVNALARRTCVVIPALNESLRIREVVEGALSHCPNVIVIDDGSDDGTSECIADLPILLLRHEQRRGKGASLREGFAEALARGFSGVLTMDGDGQHLADDIPRLLDAALRYPGSMIVGSRLRKRAQQPFHRRCANEFGDWGISWGCGYRIADTQSGQRYYPGNVCALGDVPGEDFVFEAQILISAARELGVRVVSVPIESRYQGPGVAGQFRKSHFRPLRDLYRITSHVVGQVLSLDDVLAEYRRTRNTPPVIHDPSGEFAAPPPLRSVQERT
ncbi:glycosyltransferase family 2 protein [Lysobacter sp. A6]|uniref:Glycosyltransferase family 2 protein n=1 Tax=Noviluteimonas lactosilytica TaxID=2888523 RepID=A0ABS8JHA5_9GAMM|nr:glycosyltransferase family 2 protein [Lysobacter lactosilyticus]MCC8362984.1 glycosyltransferase family 2 protein [Lysobacter lactosilyticus]